MTWLKYCKRISKATNIGFVIIWLVPPISDILIHGFFDWRVEFCYFLCMAIVYSLMVWVVKKTIWDKKLKENQP